MEKDKESPEERQEKAEKLAPPLERKPWEEPKLAFVEPKLTKHGDLEKVTGRPKDGFFGPFSP